MSGSYGSSDRKLMTRPEPPSRRRRSISPPPMPQEKRPFYEARKSTTGGRNIDNFLESVSRTYGPSAVSGSSSSERRSNPSSMDRDRWQHPPAQVVDYQHRTSSSSYSMQRSSPRNDTRNSSNWSGSGTRRY
ncbi:hypothetical protein Ciccas_009124 [Cichlidogyrus casuarinus]|uniref:Uncharacterized protein n=1 Tax=Cichlidogyrus casuarinus TaxID=1844966 RepID=A0ABD2Q0P8_9PLAT